MMRSPEATPQRYAFPRELFGDFFTSMRKYTALM